MKIPVANCSSYWNCAECVLSRDPFCAWDPSRRVCTDATRIQANAGQDVDTANVREACKTPPLTPRFGFGQQKLPTGELVSVSLNEVVRLQCPEASQLAQRHWERPNSRLSQDLYLQLEDGSLHFLATTLTLGHYLCLSTENGFQQTLAVYQVKQKSTVPHSTPSTLPTCPQSLPLSTTGIIAEQATLSIGVGLDLKRTEVGPKKPRPTILASETNVNIRHTSRTVSLWLDHAGQTAVESHGRDQQTYWSELVVVSILLALCVSMLLTIGLYNMRQRCRRRTAPQISCPGRDYERGVEQEQEALSVGQSLHSNDKGTGQAGRAMCNGTPKGSNRHLPIIPL